MKVVVENSNKNPNSSSLKVLSKKLEKEIEKIPLKLLEN